MKLKCQPEDFVVTELSDLKPTEGAYGLYRLTKRGIGTLEALQSFQRIKNIAPSQVAHGGMKDRHAQTTQLVTIRNGPQTDFEHNLYQLCYLGQTRQAITAVDICGNQFCIVIRSLDKTQSQQIRERGAVVSASGFPNYFDEQRFGSMGVSQEFVAAKWCLKDYERALWLAMAEHNRHDDATERAQKQILRDHWGDWSTCKQQLVRSHRRSIVTYLVDHPEGFRKAFALINPGLRGLYLSAFQSAVWNRMLAGLLNSERQTEHETTKIGDASQPLLLPAELKYAQLPLPSAKCRQLSAEVRKLCDDALLSYGMKLSEMKLSFPRDRWFSKGQRAVVIRPNGLTVETDVDELYTGRHKATLTFDLPRGCYATMLIKSLTLPNAASRRQPSTEEDSR